MRPWIGRLGRRSLWLWGMALAQAAFFAVRSRLVGEPFDLSMGGVLLATVAAALAVARLPEGSAAGALERRARWAREHPLAAAAALALLAGALAAWVQPWPSFDEAFVADAAHRVTAHGLRGLADAYRENDWLRRRHPPLLPVLLGLAGRPPLGGPAAWRLASAACLAGTAALTTGIARRLGASAAAGALLATMPLAVRLGGAASNDLPVTLLATAAFATALELADRGGARRGLLLGAILGLGLLVKYTMALAFAAVLGVLAGSGALRERRREVALAAAVAAVPALVWLGAAAELGVLRAQMGWIGRTGAVGARSLLGPWSPGETLLAKLPAAVGLYHLPLLALGAAALARRGGAQARVLGLWICAIALPLLLTLPENRYFLPAFPALAITAALGLDRLPRWRGEVALLALLLCLVTVGYYATLEVRARAQLWPAAATAGRIDPPPPAEERAPAESLPSAPVGADARLGGRRRPRLDARRDGVRLPLPAQGA